MLTIKVYWAGQLITSYRVDNKGPYKNEKLAKIQEDLSAGRITKFFFGKTFVITELCVDVMCKSSLSEMYNFKA